MTGPKGTLWPLGHHTVGKHRVLKHYLDAWLPIMGSRNSRILFIDGFAGPGEYSKGEPGSPAVAIRALAEHAHQGMVTAELAYYFVESRADRAAHLRGVVADLGSSLPANVRVYVEEGEFDDKMGSILDFLEAQGTSLPPAFVMIDPFGVSGVSMDTIGKLLRNPKCEVFISFMYDFINRFKKTPEFERHLDALFGCAEWRNGVNVEDSAQRAVFLKKLFRKQLKNAGAKYVINFDLFKGSNDHVYSIFFGTSDLTGCSKMKDAMWRVSPQGDYSFRGGELDQLVLGVEPDTGPLRKQLTNKFRGHGTVSVEMVEDFIKSDETMFRKGHLIRMTLRPMEKEGLIRVSRPPEKNVGFATGTRIEFL